MNKKWNYADIEYLKENAHQLTDQEIANELTKNTGREFTLVAVRRRRQRLGLKKVQGRGYCSLQPDSIHKEIK